MKVLALEPYYGGSHKAFLDGWTSHSEHEWTIIGLPPYKWKWRMRHSAITLANDINRRIQNNENWDVLFCSDMLNLAEFKGLANSKVAQLPTVIYFHENQLTYPVRVEKERDLHFGLTNFSSAIAAEQVWFNSAFHRDSFLLAVQRVLKKMSDNNCLDEIEKIRNKSIISPQGINQPQSYQKRNSPPAHILWAARWEHDKNPELFFNALFYLQKQDVDFRVSVLGESFSDIPPIFPKAKELLSSKILHWGYQPSKEDYFKILCDADIVVSTADHEFFGISIAEAVASGAFPILPNRLSYPEIFDYDKNKHLFYDGSQKDLVDKLRHCINNVTNGSKLDVPLSTVNQYFWSNIGAKLDTALTDLSNIEQF